MNDINLEFLENFDALWARVQNGGGAEPIGPDPREAALDRLYQLCRGYETIAQGARGEVRRQLLGLRQETQSMIRHLQAGLFLDTGDTFIPVECGIFCKLNATNLQKIWKVASELVQACRKPETAAFPAAEADLEATAAMAEGQMVVLRRILQALL